MAYSATVSTPLSKCERISRSLGVLAGKVNVASYNTTLIEITAITKYFVTGGVSGFTQGIIAVLPTGISDNGHDFVWDYATGAFKCYTPTAATIAVDSNVGAGAALLFASGGGTAALHATSAVGNFTYSGAASEASNDDDVGEIGFIAIGFI